MLFAELPRVRLDRPRKMASKRYYDSSRALREVPEEMDENNTETSANSIELNTTIGSTLGNYYIICYFNIIIDHYVYNELLCEFLYIKSKI